MTMKTAGKTIDGNRIAAEIARTRGGKRVAAVPAGAVEVGDLLEFRSMVQGEPSFVDGRCIDGQYAETITRYRVTGVGAEFAQSGWARGEDISYGGDGRTEIRAARQAQYAYITPA